MFIHPIGLYTGLGRLDIEYPAAIYLPVFTCLPICLSLDLFV
jgi:hypothetical protein